MSMKRKPVDLDKAKRLYASGYSTKQVGERIGVCAERVRQELIAAGIPRRGNNTAGPRNKLRRSLPDAMICRMYLAGRSEKFLADHFETERSSIRLRLIEGAIVPRGRHDSAILLQSQTPKKERMRRAEAAHAAVRGKRQTMEHRCKIAATREIRLSNVSDTERLYALTLAECGLQSVLQKAVGPYNVDIALTESAIAVEVFGGGWHGSGFHANRFRERTDYLINRGWIPVIVWHDKSRMYGTGAIKYIIALAEKIRRGETVGRQEHMIWSNGENKVVGKRQLNGIPFIPSPDPRDRVTGRFTKRPR